MSSSTPIPTSPMRRHSDRYEDRSVFSSPARDVGWSPIAANTPLGGLFYEENATRPAADMRRMFDINISPIRRTSSVAQGNLKSQNSDSTPSGYHESVVDVSIQLDHCTSSAKHRATVVQAQKGCLEWCIPGELTLISIVPPSLDSSPSEASYPTVLLFSWCSLSQSRSVSV
jgi:hypothetical protein